MFDKFCDYMYSLLFTPLKKIRQTENQFYIFFKVMGQLLDDTKTDIFRIREESIIASASAVLLAEHGKDRNLQQLRDEPEEGYRRRLMMKAVIAEKAGTVAGLMLCLQSLDLDGEIVPWYLTDATRWAEFLVKLKYPLEGSRPVNMDIVKSQIRLIKPASALDDYLLMYYSSYKVKTKCAAEIGIATQFYPRYNLEYLRFDGTWQLDGTRKLNGYNSNDFINFYPMQCAICTELLAAPNTDKTIGIDLLLEIPTEQSTEMGLLNEIELEVIEGCRAAMETEVNQDVCLGSLEMTVVNRLDGTWLLDGTRKLNGGTVLC